MWKSASATSAAAPPPTPLNSATISGIAVIFTARAAYAPIGAATAITIRIDAKFVRPGVKNVATIANGHAERADQVAVPRLRRVREVLERDDEADDRDQVREVDPVGPAHSALLFLRSAPSSSA